MGSELKYLLPNGHRVTGVITALKPDHHIGLLREVINYPSFALVAPLRAYNGCYCHNCCPFFTVRSEPIEY